jgi:hypothetical protein
LFIYLWLSISISLSLCQTRCLLWLQLFRWHTPRLKAFGGNNATLQHRCTSKSMLRTCGVLSHLNTAPWLIDLLYLLQSWKNVGTTKLLFSVVEECGLPLQRCRESDHDALLLVARRRVKFSQVVEKVAKACS